MSLKIAYPKMCSRAFSLGMSRLADEKSELELVIHHVRIIGPDHVLLRADDGKAVGLVVDGLPVPDLGDAKEPLGLELLQRRFRVRLHGRPVPAQDIVGPRQMFLETQAVPDLRRRRQGRQKPGPFGHMDRDGRRVFRDLPGGVQCPGPALDQGLHGPETGFGPGGEQIDDPGVAVEQNPGPGIPVSVQEGG